MASPTGTVIGWPVSITSTPLREAVGGFHGDGAHLVVAEVLLHLADHLVLALADADLEGVVDGRDLVREPDVDDRPDHLDDCACVHRVNSASRVW